MGKSNEIQYRVIVPNLPTELHSTYAAEAVAQAKAREHAEQERGEARRQKQAEIKASLEEIDRQNKARAEKEAEALAEKQAQEFEERLKEAYFVASPWASERDWLRDKSQLKSDALRSRALDKLQDRETRVAIEKKAFLESGRYEGF